MLPPKKDYLTRFVIGWNRKVLEEQIRRQVSTLAAATAAVLVELTEAFYPDDTARVVVGAVSGIGFLAAGAILRSSIGEVRGHTTGASLGVSAILMADGTGHELLGILLALLLYPYAGCIR